MSAFPVFTPNGIVTTGEICHVCQGPMTVEHGHVALYDTETGIARETSTLQHCEICEECGVSYPVLLYDCEHCMKGATPSQERTLPEPVYQFQCNRCFIVSGRMSRNPEDAPTCCGGEKMVAVAIKRRITD